MEYFDLINENDEVVGVTTKEKSHNNDELHRVVAIYVFDEKGRLYMQEHLLHNGKYDNSVGGHIMRGESYDDAARREGFEELGITDVLQKVSIFHPEKVFLGYKNNHRYGLYEVTPSKKWNFVPNDEVKNVVPLPIEKIVNLMNSNPEKFVKGFIYTMREYIKKKKMPYEIIIT